MTALAALTAELNRINGSPAMAAGQGQLARVQARIADALASRNGALTQHAWREVNERLHRLYVLEHEIKKGAAKCPT